MLPLVQLPNSPGATLPSRRQQASQYLELHGGLQPEFFPSFPGFLLELTDRNLREAFHLGLNLGRIFRTVAGRENQEIQAERLILCAPHRHPWAVLFPTLPLCQPELLCLGGWVKLP
jgi:hypothetical protein